MKQKAIPAEVCKKNLNVATVLLTLGKIDGAYEKVCGSMSQGLVEDFLEALGWYQVDIHHSAVYNNDWADIAPFYLGTEQTVGKVKGTQYADGSFDWTHWQKFVGTLEECEEYIKQHGY